MFQNELHKENGKIYFYYGHIQKIKEEIEIAKKYSGFQTTVIGKNENSIINFNLSK